ncbi:MAG: extracellular solute-binding protein [Planctomycetota bacterium]|jgi:raffinose/stachyose/melibiose transport system substrate-binding protein
MRGRARPRPGRFFILAAMAACVMALAGCGRKDATPSGGAGKEITFWHIYTRGPTKEVVNAAIARFEAANPGVTVRTSEILNDPYKQKLALGMAAGSPPDVFFTWGGGILAADARAGRVLDLAGRVPEDELARMNPAALEFCRSSRRLWALPADVAAVVFWYNRDIFAEHDVEPPGTYAQLVAACEKLKSAGVTPLALGNSDSWPGAFYFCYFATRLGAIVPSDVSGKEKRHFSFDEKPFIEAGALSRGLAEKGFFTKGFNGLDYTRARQLFFQGRAAMVLMGVWVLADARGEAPAGFVEKMGCFAFPKVSEYYAATEVLGGMNAGYAVSSKCAHPDEAVALVRELTSLESARAWAATGRIPALTAELAAPMLPPETRGAAEILGKAHRIQLYYDQALPPELAELHKTTTQGILGGTTSPEEAARLMEDAARRVLGPRWTGDFAR